jgi:hypothetical protein
MLWSPKPLFALKLISLLALTFIYSAPIKASQGEWTIEKGTNLISKHEIDPKKGTIFNLSRLYYDLKEKMFILDMAQLNEEAIKSGLTRPPHHITYVIQPETGREQWINTLRTEDLFGKSVYPLPPYAEEINFYSERLRQEGNKSIRQPFGNHKILLEIDEKTYKKRKLGSGATFSNFQLQSKLVGKGHISLKIIDPNDKTIFSLKEKYTENSEEYTLYWSPDGRYLFMVMPHSSSLFGGIRSFSSYKFLIAGPFKTSKNTPLIQATLSQKRDALIRKQENSRNQIKEKNKDYGSLYVSARTKVMSCFEINEKTGKILSLSIKDKGDILNFGNPVLVGKHYIFSYQAQNNKGNIRISVIKPQYMDEWGDKYKNYLETADIQTESSTYHVSCS